MPVDATKSKEEIEPTTKIDTFMLASSESPEKLAATAVSTSNYSVENTQNTGNNEMAKQRILAIDN